MNILLGVTGSIASTLTQKLKVALALEGHSVKTIVTKSALRLKRSDDAWGDYYTDESEWEIHKWENRVLHIDLAKWAEVFLIAPCTANTISKIILRLADNLLTNCVLAYPKTKPLLIAPAMNTTMFENMAPPLIERYRDFDIISPQEKTLYCGDTGLGAMAEISDIIASVNSYKPITT